MIVPNQLLAQLVNIIDDPNLNLYLQSPYNLDLDSEDAYFHRVIADFNAAKTFILFPEHTPGSWLIDYPFGEGYSSFFHLFIYPPKDASTKRLADGNQVQQIIHGIVFEINRKAPIAVYSAGYSIKVYENGLFVSGTTGFAELDFTLLDRLPAGDWYTQLEEATHILARHGVFLLSQNHFEQALQQHPYPEITAAQLFSLWFHKEL
jgi:hypothetical protein